MSHISKLARYVISIHSLYVEGDDYAKENQSLKKISIHSLYVEGDMFNNLTPSAQTYFNPLPLCRGRRYRRYHKNTTDNNFNPLPLCRGRLAFPFLWVRGTDFNPLPLCRGRLRGVVVESLDYYILCLISLFLASDVWNFTKTS